MAFLKYVLGGVGAATLVAGVVAPTVSGADTSHRKAGTSAAPVVVVSGLNNPRQLSLVHGKLLIAEAGKGGTIPFNGPEGPGLIGDTGSISAVYGPRWAHDQSPNRIITGLMSAAAPDGSAATGSDGVTTRGRHGSIYIQETFVPPELLPESLARQDGKLLKVRRHSDHLHAVADLARFERNHDPDNKGFDSDPYAVLAVRGGLLVADAAANDVLRVGRHGRVHVFHVFPNVRSGACAGQFDPDPAHPGCNFVPTSLATDRWGHVYVGGLSSLTPGEARVVKLSRNGRHVLRVWHGFSAVTGVAVDRNGALYVSQLFADEANPPDPMIQGVLTRIGRYGHRTNIDVPFPAGVVVDRHANVYVSAWSIAPDTGLAGPGTSGQVWRLRF